MADRLSYFFRKSCAEWYFTQERPQPNWPARQEAYRRMLNRYGVKIVTRNLRRLKRALDTIEGGFRGE